ncbi:hypothetical protein [Psychrobacter sp. I-STPA6b]|uniref:hypothetical protein n=1 Tax=Psychrobacter sp. I-STPA6b TaxID=2585718 RepID=UPI001D0C85A1|nr:hypothetical protein [Psychrobacter sp. I-STPA6b]
MGKASKNSAIKRYYHYAHMQKIDIFIIFIFLAMSSAYMPTVDIFFNWWQATHWLGYVFVIFLIWISVNNYWGQYWQISHNSLDYYFSFIRVKHIALTDISHITGLEQQDNDQKLKIYDSQQSYSLNKPKMTIDSQYCLDFSNLVQQLKNKLPQLVQSSVNKESQEYYQKKNRKVNLMIWSLFWLIIILKLFWQRAYMAWDIKFLFATGLIMILVSIFVGIWKNQSKQKITQSQADFILHQYALFPVLVLYLLLNIYIYVF